MTAVDNFIEIAPDRARNMVYMISGADQGYFDPITGRYYTSNGMPYQEAYGQAALDSTVVLSTFNVPPHVILSKTSFPRRINKATPAKTRSKEVLDEIAGPYLKGTKEEPEILRVYGGSLESEVVVFADNTMGSNYITVITARGPHYSRGTFGRFRTTLVERNLPITGERIKICAGYLKLERADTSSIGLVVRRAILDTQHYSTGKNAIPGGIFVDIDSALTGTSQKVIANWLRNNGFRYRNEVGFPPYWWVQKLYR